jgi:hypothetical protein
MVSDQRSEDQALRLAADFLDYFEARSQIPLAPRRDFYRDSSGCDRSQHDSIPVGFTPRRLQGWSR